MEANPDSGFMRKLKELDHKLGCRFNQDIERFVITYERATGEPVPILTVKSPFGGFRQPDDRDIKALRMADQQCVDLTAKLEKTAKHMENVRERQKKLRKANIRDWTKDDKYQLRRKIGKLNGASSKADRPFRPITPKIKGKVFG